MQFSRSRRASRSLEHSWAAGVGSVSLACVIVGSGTSAGAAPIPGGTWLLEERSGQMARDVSGNRNHGTLGSSSLADSNDPSRVPGALPGTTALRFVDDDFVTVPDSPSLESARITVGAVVRASGSPGPYRYVVSKGALQCEAASYGLYTGANGGLSFYISNGMSFTVSPDAGADVWDGRWHVVSGSFDGTTVRLHVDGEEVGSGSPSTVTTTYGLPEDRFFIGDYRGFCGTPLGFVGDIDAVAVLQDVVNWRPFDRRPNGT